jgi:hypothetical protein
MQVHDGRGVVEEMRRHTFATAIGWFAIMARTEEV